MDIWCIWQRQGQAEQGQARKRQRQRKAKTARTTRTGQGQEQGPRTRLNVGIVDDVDTTRKIVGSRRTPKVVRRENTDPGVQLHNLDSKPSIVEPEVEIDEFTMTYLNVDALQESEKVRGSEWIKIGVDTGAGKTAWPQSMTYGTTIPGDSDLTFRTATGELVRGGKRMQLEGCDDWGSNLKIRGVQAPVCNPLLSENPRQRVGSLCCMVTKVICSTKVRLMQRRWMLGSRRS